MSVEYDLTPERMDAFRETMRDREKRDALAREKRRAAGRLVADKAAALLKERFAAEKVVLFGSLAHQQWFSDSSDIDLAVWGLESDQYFLAVAVLQDVAPPLKIDLIDMNVCPPELRATIMEDGVVL